MQDPKTCYVESELVYKKSGTNAQFPCTSLLQSPIRGMSFNRPPCELAFLHMFLFTERFLPRMERSSGRTDRTARDGRFGGVETSPENQ